MIPSQITWLAYGVLGLAAGVATGLLPKRGRWYTAVPILAAALPLFVLNSELWFVERGVLWERLGYKGFLIFGLFGACDLGERVTRLVRQRRIGGGGREDLEG